MPKPNPTPRLCNADGCQNPVPHNGRYCSPLCRLYAHTDRSGGPDACWTWTSYVNPRTGYGQYDRDVTAHRLSYRLHYGADPGNLCVLHKCDCRVCVNPRHLFLGTKADNWRDSVAKGRQDAIMLGEANAAAKLTAVEVLAIRRSAAAVADLVRQFGVSRKNIRLIQDRKTWKHVADPLVAD